MFGPVPAFWQRRSPGGGGGSLTWYEGFNASPGGVPSGDPLTERLAMEARLSAFSVATFEEFVALTMPFNFNSTNFTRNGITSNIISSFGGLQARLRKLPQLGRFNTTSGGSVYVDGLAATETDIVEIPVSPAVAAWGSYFTDLSDFTADTYIVTIYKTSGGTISKSFTAPGSTTDASLYFLGFVDSTGETYTKIEIVSTYTNPDPDLQDFFGMDDIIMVPASYIIP